MEENAGNVFFATKSSMKIRMKRKLAVVLLICISCHIGLGSTRFCFGNRGRI